MFFLPVKLLFYWKVPFPKSFLVSFVSFVVNELFLSVEDPLTTESTESHRGS